MGNEVSKRVGFAVNHTKKHLGFAVSHTAKHLGYARDHVPKLFSEPLTGEVRLARKAAQRNMRQVTMVAASVGLAAENGIAHANHTLETTSSSLVNLASALGDHGLNIMNDRTEQLVNMADDTARSALALVDAKTGAALEIVDRTRRDVVDLANVTRGQVVDLVNTRTGELVHLADRNLQDMVRIVDKTTGDAIAVLQHGTNIVGDILERATTGLRADLHHGGQAVRDEVRVGGRICFNLVVAFLVVFAATFGILQPWIASELTGNTTVAATIARRLVLDPAAFAVQLVTLGVSYAFNYGIVWPITTLLLLLASMAKLCVWMVTALAGLVVQAAALVLAIFLGTILGAVDSTVALAIFVLGSLAWLWMLAGAHRTGSIPDDYDASNPPERALATGILIIYALVLTALPINLWGFVTCASILPAATLIVVKGTEEAAHNADRVWATVTEFVRSQSQSLQLLPWAFVVDTADTRWL